MDDTFGNAFMVEMEYLFAQDKIFEQRRSVLSGTQAVLIVRDAVTEIVGQMRGPIPVICLSGYVLMQLAALTGLVLDRPLYSSRPALSQRILKAGRRGVLTGFRTTLPSLFCGYKSYQRPMAY